MSPYVSSSSQVILRQHYTSAIDLWAVGCIFKELLELQPDSRFRTGALFPGRYCIPFSFDDAQRERQRHDQLAVIAARLGTPTADEMAWAGEAARAEAWLPRRLGLLPQLLFELGRRLTRLHHHVAHEAWQEHPGALPEGRF